ncbi:hypothetical protein BP5796_03148 [Coleophoma crateriformis]|uniref:adenine phosphoribosyltransferase n=1 Tax=Coleophoma crateriformis TaxID=565419 RepID=A0A3D8SMP3_9HELO|nr:hypothetical protein BP5796_03148 [Coleophoma crateriformis]
MATSAEEAVKLVLSRTKMYTDHPIPGQLFLDIFPIWRDPAAAEAVTAHLASHIKSTHDLSKISALVCLEARGFFFAPQVAARLSLPVVPVRKNGKLPGECVSVTYQKEYGPDIFQMKTDSFEGISGEGRKDVILVDDLLGHGGSIKAAKELVEMLGMNVVEALFIFDIPDYYERNQKNLGDLQRHAMVHLTA